MKQSHKFAVGLIASLSFGVAVVTAYAQPGPMGGGTGPHMRGGMQHGMAGGTDPGFAHRQAGSPELMTQEERSAMIERMHNAATPEERQKVIAENRAAMQKRAQEKGITLPEHRGPHAGFGPRSGTRPQAPATN
jgi:Spy/CpxP family protein refolding chaperone